MPKQISSIEAKTMTTIMMVQTSRSTGRRPPRGTAEVPTVLHATRSLHRRKIVWKHSSAAYLIDYSSCMYGSQACLAAWSRARPTCSEYVRTTSWTTSGGSSREGCQRLAQNNVIDGDAVKSNPWGPVKYAWTNQRIVYLHRVATSFVAIRVPLPAIDVQSVEVRSVR